MYYNITTDDIINDQLRSHVYSVLLILEKQVHIIIVNIHFLTIRWAL